jgi:hypothetical protein
MNAVAPGTAEPAVSRTTRPVAAKPGEECSQPFSYGSRESLWRGLGSLFPAIGSEKLYLPTGYGGVDVASLDGRREKSGPGFVRRFCCSLGTPHLAGKRGRRMVREIACAISRAA